MLSELSVVEVAHFEKWRDALLAGDPDTARHYAALGLEAKEERLYSKPVTLDERPRKRRKK